MGWKKHSLIYPEKVLPWKKSLIKKLKDRLYTVSANYYYIFNRYKKPEYLCGVTNIKN